MLRLGPDSNDRITASAMISSEGEIMEYRNAVFAEGNKYFLYLFYIYF